MTNKSDSHAELIEKYSKKPGMKHTQEHLIFGFFAKKFPAAYLWIAAGAAQVLMILLGSDHANPIRAAIDMADTAFIGLIFIFSGISFLRKPLQVQAYITCIGVKITGGILALLMLIFSILSYANGKLPLGTSVLGLGLIWMPGIEFIPKISKYQRHITIARFLCSIPCVYFAVKYDNML